MKNQLVLVSIVLASSLATLSCGSSSTAEVAAAATSALAGAYPTGLSLSAFSTTTGTSSVLKTNSTNALDQEREETFDPSKQKMGDKAADQKKLIEGTADTCFNPSILRSIKPMTTSTCYQFDKDIKLGYGSVGGEACLVSYARDEMSTAIGKVDQIINMIGAMFCQAKKSGTDVTLPAIGGTPLDLKTTMNAAVTANKDISTAPTITKALVTRLADDTTTGHAVYKTDLTYTAGANTREIHLVNSPGDTADEFGGTIWMSDSGGVGGGAAGAPNGGAHARTTQAHYLSVTYAKSGTTAATQKLVYEVREAKIDTALGDPFTEAGQLNYNIGADFTVTKGPNTGYGNYTGYAEANLAVDGIHYLSFEVNPNTSEGNFAYWVNPGGNYYENARGMIFEITAQADGTLSGCGASGSAGTMNGNPLSIRRSINEAAEADTSLTPRGYYHPTMAVADWIPTELSSSQNGSKIYKQCFTQNATTGLYAIDTTKTADTTNNFDIIATAALTMAPPNVGAAKPFDMNIKK